LHPTDLLSRSGEYPLTLATISRGNVSKKFAVISTFYAFTKLLPIIFLIEKNVQDFARFFLKPMYVEIWSSRI